MSFEDLRSYVNLWNLVFWIQSGERMAINCPKHGWVDNDWQECGKCGQCERSKK